MADTNTPKSPERSDSMQREQGGTQNQTMQHEQAKASVSGSDKSGQFGGQNAPQGSQREQGSDSREKSAIGGADFDKNQAGEKNRETGQGGESRSETGEPGRARSELDKAR